MSTALILAALGRETPGILASGGIRSGMDVVRAVALGAESAGTALPFIRAVHAGGVDGAVAYGRQVEKVVRTAMLLTGSRTVEELRRSPIWLSKSLEEDAAAVIEAEGHSS
jgi:isopentenyl diphosphate isomerase/L-lactate dehydrogenase-like FMN-dependent dehydrogenase